MREVLRDHLEPATLRTGAAREESGQLKAYPDAALKKHMPSLGFTTHGLPSSHPCHLLNL